MEDENDFMSIFGSSNELNMDYNMEDTDDEDVDDTIPNPDENNNDVVDDEDNSNQEGVDDSDDNDGSDSNTDDESSPNFYSSVAEALYEQGILPSFDSTKEIKTVDDFVEQFNIEIKNQSAIQLQQYLDNLDLNKVAEVKRENLNLDSADEDYLKGNLEVAKQLIYSDYLNQGLSEDRATKMLKKTIDLGEDVILEEALESVTSLKEYNKRVEAYELAQAQERLVQSRREQEETETKVKSYVFESNDLIQGLSLTKALREKVYKSMIEPVAKNPETGEMMNKFMQDRSINPIEFDTKMYYLYELTNGFKDINNISKTIGSKAVKNLENTIRKTKFEDNGAPGFLQDPDSYSSGFGSELVF